ncbi:MAG: SPOR domain-containing protein [Proteobacteria bacterium]|nr:SPOR domain-containing protein [Pseudomonadota bacterium]
MMDRQLKQRVVGAGLLVALGVIFIPIFLDNGGVESPVPPSMNIPPAPTEDVSQRAPALGEDAVAEMEAQADEDVELPPSRVQSGEGSNAEPAPLAMPSASGEAPAVIETLEEGAAVESDAAVPAADGATEMLAPRMQPPAPRSETPPALEAPPMPVAPVSEPAPKAPVKAVESKAVSKPPAPKPVTKSAESKPEASDSRAESKPVSKPVEPKATPKPTESKAVETRSAEAKAPLASKPAVPTVGAWTVQLGSFSSDLNAKKLVDKLKAAGYKAYTEPRLEQGVTVFKVRVGPTPGKAEAERLRQRIEAQFEARGMLVPSR